MSPQLGAATKPSERLSLTWWLQIAIFIVFVILGQSIIALLGRLYYDKGGNSKWLLTLVQLIGFPVILPLYYILPPEKKTQMDITPSKYCALQAGSIYIFLGLFSTAVSMFYSIGMQYLPVSTFGLICASELAFNALFSFLLNSQNFTPYILNSLFLLTISSTLLVINSNSAIPKGVSKSNYYLGLVFAIVFSAGSGLGYALTQLAIKRVLKSDSFKVILNMTIYESAAASLGAVVGLFGSGEWKTLKGEMEQFELGKISYLMTLIWTALTCQMFTIGLFGLMIKVSSLFSNVVSVFALPVVQVLAVLFFHDQMDGIKVLAMLLAIWGFASYSFQQYLDYYKAQTTSLTIT